MSEHLDLNVASDLAYGFDLTGCFVPEMMTGYFWPYAIDPEAIAAAERKRQWDAMSDHDRAKAEAVHRSKTR